MESPILIENGYMESGEGRMRESYSVYCDDDFTPSPGMAIRKLKGAIFHKKAAIFNRHSLFIVCRASKFL
jgi:hypothetical protein